MSSIRSKGNRNTELRFACILRGEGVEMFEEGLADSWPAGFLLLKVQSGGLSRWSLLA
jgi:hypothetical protein